MFTNNNNNNNDNKNNNNNNNNNNLIPRGLLRVAPTLENGTYAWQSYKNFISSDCLPRCTTIGRLA